MQNYDIDVDSQTIRTAMRMAQSKKTAKARSKIEKIGGMIKKSSLMQQAQFDEISSASAIGNQKNKNIENDYAADENGFNNTGDLLMRKEDGQVEVMPGANRSSQQ